MTIEPYQLIRAAASKIDELMGRLGVGVWCWDYQDHVLIISTSCEFDVRFHMQPFALASVTKPLKAFSSGSGAGLGELLFRILDAARRELERDEAAAAPGAVAAQDAVKFITVQSNPIQGTLVYVDSEGHQLQFEDYDLLQEQVVDPLEQLLGCAQADIVSRVKQLKDRLQSATARNDYWYQRYIKDKLRVNEPIVDAKPSGECPHCGSVWFRTVHTEYPPLRQCASCDQKYRLPDKVERRGTCLDDVPEPARGPVICCSGDYPEDHEG